MDRGALTRERKSDGEGEREGEREGGMGGGWEGGSERERGGGREL